MRPRARVHVPAGRRRSPSASRPPPISGHGRPVTTATARLFPAPAPAAERAPPPARPQQPIVSRRCVTREKKLPMGGSGCGASSRERWGEERWGEERWRRKWRGLRARQAAEGRGAWASPQGFGPGGSPQGFASGRSQAP